jgi:hypothetical protein
MRGCERQSKVKCGLNRALLERGVLPAFPFPDRSKKENPIQRIATSCLESNSTEPRSGQPACSDRERGKNHQDGGAQFNTKAPQTPFRVTGRSFEQPSPEVCSISTYPICLSSGMALPCNRAARLGYSLEGVTRIES